MPRKITKNIWVEKDAVREVDKDRAIKEMAKHPGAVIVGGPMVRLEKEPESPPGKSDPGTSDLLNRIRELTR